ncbi:hypothetical protein ONZ45_g6109 [Pleurotus djamor]|nr:hypothetical protein ONZ45_g6109 [Pleurotus djamor]
MSQSKRSSSIDEKRSAPSLELGASATDGIDPEAEARLVRKLDLRLVPLFTLIFLLLDIFILFADLGLHRTAIGNANIAGIQRDLGLRGFDFNEILTIFYVFFVVTEIPSNVLLKQFGSITLAIMVTGFGVATFATAFVHDYAGLAVTRVLLGIFEGGTLPGLAYILSRYYRKREYVMRLGIFFGTAPCLAGAFGGLLASGLLRIGDFGPVTTWRKIFFVEGTRFLNFTPCLITMVVGLSCIYLLPSDPRTTKMLTEEERALAIARLDADRVVKNQGKVEKTTMKLIWRAFNFNAILCGMVYLLLNISFQGLALFMPTVINNLGRFTVVMAQLRTVPPYVTAAIWGLIFCYLGLRLRKRAILMLISMPLVVAGYAIAISTNNTDARYAACFLIIAGAIPTGPLVFAWGVDNSAPETVRAVTTAMIPGIGAIGAIIA